MKKKKLEAKVEYLQNILKEINKHLFWRVDVDGDQLLVADERIKDLIKKGLVKDD